jgi:50S ribosomal subunit-associated GTPase HflX
VFNKIDAAVNLDKQKISKLAGDIPHVFISAKTKEGIETLTSTLLPHIIQGKL